MFAVESTGYLQQLPPFSPIECSIITFMAFGDSFLELKDHLHLQAVELQVPPNSHSFPSCPTKSRNLSLKEAVWRFKCYARGLGRRPLGHRQRLLHRAHPISISFQNPMSWPLWQVLVPNRALQVTVVLLQNQLTFYRTLDLWTPLPPISSFLKKGCFQVADVFNRGKLFLNYEVQIYSMLADD